jgi:hypothetical protein
VLGVACTCVAMHQAAQVAPATRAWAVPAVSRSGAWRRPPPAALFCGTARISCSLWVGPCVHRRCRSAAVRAACLQRVVDVAVLHALKERADWAWLKTSADPADAGSCGPRPALLGRAPERLEAGHVR